jgi:hypothetical protein
MVNRKFIITGLFLLLLFSPLSTVFAADSPPRTATRVSDCGTQGDETKPPWNCVFLEEPIGGKTGEDLFLVNCTDPAKCSYTLYQGGSYDPAIQRVVQALLSQDPARPHEGSLGILFNYLRLVYNFMSGIIIGIVVLFTVIGGVQMITSGGDENKYGEGKDRIRKAVLGMILWFTASLILYFINPTFFTFLT